MLNPWYITGFCDGEAAFTYSRSFENLAIIFGLKQREDNNQIIFGIHSYFNNIGHIYRQKESLSNKINNGYSKPATYFRVSKINELKIIIGHFDKYPLQAPKKLAAYKVWREMVMYKADHFRGGNYQVLNEMAERLSTLNSQTRSYKRHIR